MKSCHASWHAQYCDATHVSDIRDGAALHGPRACGLRLHVHVFNSIRGAYMSTKYVVIHDAMYRHDSELRLLTVDLHELKQISIWPSHALELPGTDAI
jgi:hypothetical protein